MDINRESIRSSIENVSGKDVALGAAAIMSGGVGALALAAYQVGKFTKSKIDEAMSKETSMPAEEGPKQSQPHETLNKAWLPQNVQIPGKAELAALLRAVIPGKGKESSETKSESESHEVETKSYKPTTSESKKVSSSSEEDPKLRENQTKTIAQLKGFLKIYPNVESKITLAAHKQILSDGIGEDPVQTQEVIKKVQELVKESQMEALVKFTRYTGIDFELEKNLTPDEKQIFNSGSGDDLQETQNLIEKLPLQIQESQRGVLSGLTKLIKNYPALGKDLTQADKDLLNEAAKGKKSEHVDIQKMDHAQQLIGDLQAQLREHEITLESAREKLANLDDRGLDLEQLETDFNLWDIDKKKLTKDELKILDDRGVGHSDNDVDKLIKKMEDLIYKKANQQTVKGEQLSVPAQPYLGDLAINQENMAVRKRALALEHLDIEFSFLKLGDKTQLTEKELEILGAKGISYPAEDVDKLIKKMEDLKTERETKQAETPAKPAQQSIKPSSTLAPPTDSRRASRASVSLSMFALRGKDYSNQLNSKELDILEKEGEGYDISENEALVEKLKDLEKTEAAPVKTETTPADIKEETQGRNLNAVRAQRAPAPVRGNPGLSRAKEQLAALEQKGKDNSDRLTEIEKKIVEAKGEGYNRAEILGVVDKLKLMG